MLGDFSALLSTLVQGLQVEQQEQERRKQRKKRGVWGEDMSGTASPELDAGEL